MMRWCGPGVALAASLLLAGCDDGGDATAEETVVRPVKVMRVAPDVLRLERSYPATVLPSQEVELSFEVGGRIVELPVRAASRLEEGDIVAGLDDSAYANTVDQLESEVAAARAELDAMVAGARDEDVRALQARVNAAQAEVDAAREQVGRSEQLFERGVVTKARLDEDKRRLRVAESNLQAAQEELSKGLAGARAEEVEAQRAKIAGLEARLASARRDLRNATLRAPFAGIIAKRMVDNFTFVQPKQPIALLQNVETLELVFDIPGPDVARFAGLDQPAAFATIDSLPGARFDVRLVEFSIQADAATQTYRGRVAMDRPEGVSARAVLPGMVATVTVYDPGASEDTLTVPPGAVASGPDGSAFIWVVGEDDTVARRPVTMGEAVGERVVITEGLSEGDIVVTAGLGALREGMAVRPLGGTAG